MENMSSMCDFFFFFLEHFLFFGVLHGITKDD